MNRVWLFLVGFCTVVTVDAQSWLTPWQARQTIAVWNYNVREFANHQVRLEVSLHECMDSTFTDLRFTKADGVTLLDHWTMHVAEGEEAIVYVEIDLLPLYSQTMIYMYYGNTAADDASDPVATMVYYDDLDSDTGWNDIGSSSITFETLADGTTVLVKSDNCDSSGAWKSLPSARPTWKLLSKERRTTIPSSPDCGYHKYGIETQDYSGTGLYRDGIGTNGEAYMGVERRDGGELTEQVLDVVPEFTTEWYYTEVSHCDICLFNVNAIIWDEDMQLVNSLYHYNYEMLTFDRFTIRGGSPYELDYIAVANKSCIEPMPSFGEIESCPVTELLSYTADECETGDGELVIRVAGDSPPYDICWYMDGDSLGMVTVGDSAIITLDSLSLGTYMITAKDASGCKL